MALHQNALVILASLGSLFSQTWAQEVSDSAFTRRGNHVAAVVGNYLYLDGGEVSQLVDGKVEEPWPSRTVNSTFSIPLDQPWTNKTVVFKETPVENESSMNHASVWTDAGSDSTDATKMYIWGGERGYTIVTDEARNPRLRIFTADGKGGGSWAHEELPKPQSIVRVAGPSGVGCGGFGYTFGGFSSERTDFRIRQGGLTPVPGLIKYDIASKSWTNETALVHPPFGTFQMGRAVCLRGLGAPGSADDKATGLAFFMGGAAITSRDMSETTPIDFQNVTFYDGRRWHSQMSTGEAPQPRVRHCIVAARSGDAGSYEIFVYGGASALKVSENQGFADLHILTVPGFRWFKVDYSKNPEHRRQGHTCNAIPGKRLMVNVGGYEDGFGGESWRTTDPWTKGIGVFDMTALEWLDRYDPAARAYESLKIVKDWYKNGGLSTVKWDNEETKKLFSSINADSLATGNTDNGSSGGQDDSTSGNKENGNTNEGAVSENQSGGSNIGAIAGGVVGGVVFLALLAALGFVIVRRRRLQTSQREDDQASSPGLDASNLKYQTVSEMALTDKPQEVATVSSVHELSTMCNAQELQGSRVFYELETPQMRQELAAR
ncbi:hypothetical protein PgNI_10847 [Pyricularia grisea]|uniref:Kelch repeat protein n=1 Tax=Pyricularia grisea TaxID=148305 RepID=A0A6P8AXH2_PYRGI|nr:hypothetical protein PgNI_10847 [Pyricularia grisea]TLD07038.1 hypothetical protein PgNI_10847 [Pyricularia grisea]